MAQIKNLSETLLGKVSEQLSKTVAKKTIGLEHMHFQPLTESFHFAHTLLSNRSVIPAMSAHRVLNNNLGCNAPKPAGVMLTDRGSIPYLF